ncbi:MAG TPA: hypothetical protein VIL35_00110 [Vicinamibacterales bacterium]
MFTLVLWGHSMMRWIVLALGIVALYRAWRGRAGVSPWMPGDMWTSLGFVAALDAQLVVGIVLWLYSPITILGIHELDIGFADRVLRFWTFEHPVVMLVGILLANVGLLRIWLAADARRRYRIALVYFGIALALVLAGIPWTFLPYGRPLVWLP